MYTRGLSHFVYFLYIEIIFFGIALDIFKANKKREVLWNLIYLEQIKKN